MFFGFKKYPILHDIIETKNEFPEIDNFLFA